MLSDRERQAIEIHAAAEIRQQWGRVSARNLGDVVADIRTRMEDGTWGQLSIPEQVDEICRLAHERDVYARDEAALDAANFIDQLRLVEEMEGVQGVRDFADHHGLDMADCIRQLDGPELGDG